jgi:hypothetical protein
MKMVKSLLLVSAAGVVAASGAQAADLPVKAKPVEYVKVCSLYGAGFFYIPGTDICLKIGGYIRYQVGTGYGNTLSAGPFSGSGGFNNRIVNDDFIQRVRTIATWDTRQQTAYGTLRTYLLMGFSQDTSAGNPTVAPSVYNTRAFIQIAGFTFGKATSFFDFFASAAVAYNAGLIASPDTGDGGQIVGSYTAQFGNGVSATIGVEQSRRLNTVYANPVANTGGATVNPYTFAMGVPAADNLGMGTVSTAGLPDIVGNLRIDQAWGSAQVSAAAHNVSPAYYGLATTVVPGGVQFNEGNGHPDEWGWAASVGVRLNAPMFGPGDYFQVAGVWTKGAARYAAASPSGAVNSYWVGNNFAFGFYEDAVFGGTAGATPAANNAVGNALHLTTAWSVMGSYEHFWTPSLRTSLYGSYVKVTHDDEANFLICNSLAAGTANGVGFTGGCNADFAVWNIGSRSQWNVTKDFYVGVDVIYQKFESASFNFNQPFAINTNTAALPGGALTAACTNGKCPGIYQTGDQDAVSVTWRVHRDIVP